MVEVVALWPVITNALFYGVTLSVILFTMILWLVLDLLIVVTLRPRFLILPGTEGMARYADYAFHFRGFLIGLPITLFASLLLAGLVTVLL